MGKYAAAYEAQNTQGMWPGGIGPRDVCVERIGQEDRVRTVVRMVVGDAGLIVSGQLFPFGFAVP